MKKYKWNMGIARRYQFLLSIQTNQSKMKFFVSVTCQKACNIQFRHYIMFEKFSRLGAQDSNGAGLGLAISKRLVNAMGGEIGISRNIGKGAEFWFTVFDHAEEGARPREMTTA